MLKKHANEADTTQSAKKAKLEKLPFRKLAPPSPAEGSDSVVSSTFGNTRVILHCDLDCFYAQVEEQLHPQHAGKPLGVQQRMFLVTCNYAARAKGVTKLMALEEAREKCPEIVVVPSIMQHYRDASRRIFALLRSWATRHNCAGGVEAASIDEAYIDVSVAASGRAQPSPPALPSTAHCHHPPLDPGDTADARLLAGAQLAMELRAELRSTLGFTVTVGVAHNKTLAKLAGGLRKPDALNVVGHRAVHNLFLGLTVRQLPKVGQKMDEELAVCNIRTVSQLLDTSFDTLVHHFDDSRARLLYRLCRGIDDAEVHDKGAPKTVSVEASLGPNDRCRTWGDAGLLLQMRADALLVRLGDDFTFYSRRPRSLVLRWSVQFTQSVSRSAPFPSDIPLPVPAETAPQLTARLAHLALTLLQGAVDINHLPLISRVGLGATAFFEPSPSVAAFLVPRSSQQLLETGRPSSAAPPKPSKSPPGKRDGILRYLASNKPSPLEPSFASVGSNTVRCSACNQELPNAAIAEHKDYHLALSLAHV